MSSALRVRRCTRAARPLPSSHACYPQATHTQRDKAHAHVRKPATHPRRRRAPVWRPPSPAWRGPRGRGRSRWGRWQRCRALPVEAPRRKLQLLLLPPQPPHLPLPLHSHLPRPRWAIPQGRGALRCQSGRPRTPTGTRPAGRGSWRPGTWTGGGQPAAPAARGAGGRQCHNRGWPPLQQWWRGCPAGVPPSPRNSPGLAVHRAPCHRRLAVAHERHKVTRARTRGYSTCPRKKEETA